MVGEKRVPDKRDILIDRVRRGELKPEEAEVEARAAGLGPLAITAEPVHFEPLKASYWSLPMALAWIAWRDIRIVQLHCADYREQCSQWVSGSWNIRSEDGQNFQRIDGFELAAWKKSTTVRLSLSEKFMRSAGTLPANAKMTIDEAENELFEELGSGRITAIGLDGAGKPVDIPQKEWRFLDIFIEQEADVLKYDPLDRDPAFRDVALPRDGLMKTWPTPRRMKTVPFRSPGPITSEMYEKVASSDDDGYVAFDASVCWIATKGGTESAELDDAVRWNSAVAALLPKISSGKIEAIGKPGGIGSPEQVERLKFVGVKVISPFVATDRNYDLVSAPPHILCCFFGEDWDRAGGDQFFEEGIAVAEWTHLRLCKADLKREFQFTPPSVAGEAAATRMQAEILRVAKELWPDGNLPARIKDRDAAIRATFKHPPSSKSISRAFKSIA